MGLGADVRPLKEDFVGNVGNVLWVIFGTVGRVLLIACANVANLFLVRADGRQQEIAVRTALRADKRRLAREFLGESLVLGLLGGLVGLGLAYGGIRLLVARGPASVPRLYEVGIVFGTVGDRAIWATSAIRYPLLSDSTRRPSSRSETLNTKRFPKIILFMASRSREPTWWHGIVQCKYFEEEPPPTQP